MAMEYQGFATLGVNLNRQKYGPLDVSSVFTSTADLTYYRTKRQTIEEGLSDYWKVIVPYPYEGQLVSLVENGEVSVLKLVANGDVFDAIAVVDSVALPENLATQEYVQEQIQAIEMPSLDGYATEAYVDDKISGIEIGTGAVAMEAMTEDEILAAIGAASGGATTPSGQVLEEMTAEDVQNIINA